MTPAVKGEKSMQKYEKDQKAGLNPMKEL